MRLRLPSRRAVALAAAILVALHTAAWTGGLWWMNRISDAQTASLAAKGWQVHSGATHWRGWPLAARLVHDDFSMVDPAGHVAWHCGAVGFTVTLLRPTWLVVGFTAPYGLRIEGQDVPMTADRLSLSGTLAGPREVTELSARGLRVEGPLGAVAFRSVDLHIEYAAAPAADMPSAVLTATAADIDLPLKDSGPVPRRIAALHFEARATGPLPNPPNPQTATAWRAADGRVTIDPLTLSWGPLGLNANATIGLDDHLQPAGRGTARVAGLAETLDAIGAARLLPEPTVRAARALVLLLPRNKNGEVELPIALSGQLLTIARFPLVRLAEITW